MPNFKNSTTNTSFYPQTGWLWLRKRSRKTRKGIKKTGQSRLIKIALDKAWKISPLRGRYVSPAASRGPSLNNPGGFKGLIPFEARTLNSILTSGALTRRAPKHFPRFQCPARSRAGKNSPSQMHFRNSHPSRALNIIWYETPCRAESRAKTFARCYIVYVGNRLANVPNVSNKINRAEYCIPSRRESFWIIGDFGGE